MDKKYLLPGAALLSLVSGSAQAAFIGSSSPDRLDHHPGPGGEHRPRSVRGCRRH